MTSPTRGHVPDFDLVYAPLTFWWFAIVGHIFCALTRTDHTVPFALGCVGCVALGVVLGPLALEAFRALRARRTPKMRELVSVQMLVGLLALACWIASLVVRPDIHSMDLFAWLAGIAGTMYVANVFIVGSLITIEARRNR